MEQNERLEDNVKLEDIMNSMPDDIEDEKNMETVENETDFSENEISDNADEEYIDDDDNDDYAEEEDEVRSVKKKKRKRRGHGRFIFGLLFSVIVISISILAAAVILKCAKEFLGIGKSDIEIVVDIPMNSSTLDIAEQLYNEGIIADTDLFRLFSKLKGADGTFIAGTHKVSPKMDYATLVETLQEEAENQR